MLYECFVVGNILSTSIGGGGWEGGGGGGVEADTIKKQLFGFNQFKDRQATLSPGPKRDSYTCSCTFCKKRQQFRESNPEPLTLKAAS